eukprot:1837866-Amphidinium_carterae.1
MGTSRCCQRREDIGDIRLRHTFEEFGSNLKSLALLFLNEPQQQAPSLRSSQLHLRPEKPPASTNDLTRAFSSSSPWSVVTSRAFCKSIATAKAALVALRPEGSYDQTWIWHCGCTDESTSVISLPSLGSRLGI